MSSKDESGIFKVRASVFHLIPKLGRRAGHSNISHEDKLEDEALDSPESSSRKPSAKGSAPPVPPRSRKTGWGDELKSAKHRGVSAVDQDRFLSNNKNVRDDDIPVIPDLDEIIEETNAIDISKIPSIGANRAAAAAYEELDTDFVKNKKFSTFDGVDLSVLVDNLYPEHLVRETDEVWSWESLFNQVASEINTESGTKDDESH